MLRESSVSPKRPSSKACRYSGRPSRYFDVITQASAASLSRPLGITCGGLAASRRPPSQQARVLDPLVMDHAHLLWHDAHLLADLHSDLVQARAVVRAHALVAPHVARPPRWGYLREHSARVQPARFGALSSTQRMSLMGREPLFASPTESRHPTSPSAFEPPVVSWQVQNNVVRHISGR